MMAGMEMAAVEVGAGAEEDTVGEEATGEVADIVEEDEVDGDTGVSSGKVNDTLHSEGVWEDKQCCILLRGSHLCMMDARQCATTIVMLHTQTLAPGTCSERANRKPSNTGADSICTAGFVIIIMDSLSEFLRTGFWSHLAASLNSTCSAQLPPPASP